MIIVGVDVETTGLDPETDQVVELGTVLYDIKTNRVLSSYGKIYQVETWGEEAAECHQIPKELSNKMPLIGSEEFDPWKIISGDLATYIVAHNAKHDYPFVTKIWPSFKNKPWLCTNDDLKHKAKLKKISSHRLAHLCVDYHIQMGTWHQAVADAEACAQIAGKHDLDAAYQHKITPKYRFITYGDWIEDIRDVMGNAPSVLNDGWRYKWNTEEAPRAWSKDGLTIEEVQQDAEYLKEITKGKWKFEGIPLPAKPY